MILKNLPPTAEANEFNRLLSIYGFKLLAMRKHPDFEVLYNTIKQKPEYMGALLKIFDARWLDLDFDSADPTKDDKDLVNRWRRLQADFSFTEQCKVDNIHSLNCSNVVRDYLYDMTDVRKCPPLEYTEDEIRKELINELGIKKDKPEQLPEIHESEEYSDYEEEPIMASESAPDNRVSWIGIRSYTKPQIGEKTFLCGYVYRGVIEYTVGKYVGSGEWETPYDDMMCPEYHVLYWMAIPVIPGVEEEI